MIESHFVIEDRKILSSDRRRNKIATNRISIKYRVIVINIFVVSRRRLRTSQIESQYSDQVSIKCLQARAQQTHLHESLNQHMIAKVFSSSQIFIEDIYLSFSLFIVSADRALFCSVSHRVFQILMRRRQKAKFLFSHFYKISQSISYRSCTFLFCFLPLDFSDFNETSTENEKSSILFNYRASMLSMLRLSSFYSSPSLGVVVAAAIKLVRIRKWFSVYKHLQVFLLHFFFLIIVFDSKFLESAIKRVVLKNDDSQLVDKTVDDCWFEKLADLMKLRSRWKRIV